jgi:hypothetical protein
MLERVGISLEDSLLAKFDRLIKTVCASAVGGGLANASSWSRRCPLETSLRSTPLPALATNRLDRPPKPARPRQADESISYAMPAFRLKGKVVADAWHHGHVGDGLRVVPT